MDLFWNALTSITTALMAVGTFCVIWQERRHHRNTFKPICVLEPDTGVVPPDRSGILQSEVTTNSPCDGTFTIHSTLKNVGVGPAMNIRLEIRIRGIEGYGTTWPLSPLAKEQSRGDKTHPLLIPVKFHDGFNRADFESSTNQGWEIWLEYRDVFGTVFHTRHTKHPREPWAHFGDGPIPKT